MSVTVEMWLWQLDTGAPDDRDLSEDERARADRFVFARDRNRYVSGRARLRRILGQYLDRSPDSVVFGYGPNGKPEVTDIAFNLSHTGDLALLAVHPNLTLGVDIEAVRPIGMDVARAHFTPSELDVLMALPEEDRTEAFHRCWTRKEAYLKARGTGLATDLASFTVTMAPDDPAQLLTCESGREANWRLLDLAPADGIAGALAVQSAGAPVTLLWRERP